MEQQFKQIIDQAGSIVILLPRGPYFDQVAAGLALYLTLRDKKNVEIHAPTPMLVEFNRLVGVNKISTELGNKNLLVSFADYNAENIERVKYDIENKQFKLTVIPKPQATPPNKDQVILGYARISADVAILIGGANDSHFPTLASSDMAATKLVHIGISDLSLSGGRQVISFARSAASISEVMYPLVSALTEKLGPDVASNLLAGLHEGSRGFTHSMVTADTYKMAATLAELGGRYTHVNRPSSTGGSKGPFEVSVPLRPVTPHVEPVPVVQKPQVAPEPQVMEKPTVTKDPTIVEDPPKSWLQQPKIYRGASDPTKTSNN